MDVILGDLPIGNLTTWHLKGRGLGSKEATMSFGGNEASAWGWSQDFFVFFFCEIMGMPGIEHGI